MIIIRVAIAIPLNRCFDYLLPSNFPLIDAGCRVLVPFGKSTKVGFVIEHVTETEVQIEKLKSICDVLDSTSLLSPIDIELLQWAGRYYHHPLGEVFNVAFPASLRKGKAAQLPQETVYSLSAKGQCLTPKQLKRSPKQQQLFQLLQTANQPLSASFLTATYKNWRVTMKALSEKQLVHQRSDTKQPLNTQQIAEPPLTANPQQQRAIESIISHLGHFSAILLEGVTGSGKTEVYMQVIQQVLNKGQQVMILLPEITLTPQLEARFKQRFNVPIVLSHSKLTEAQRHNAWLAMQKGSGSLLLGTRSALFTPLKKAGLIILDEEHDSSFKQQEGFRFSARDLAIVKAQLHQIPIILGTATPSLESFYNVSVKRYQLLELPDRAGKATKPKFVLLDIRNKQLNEGLAEPLIKHIQQTLAKQEQVLLFLNRRGFAPVLICQSCAWVSSCHQCDTRLVVHYKQNVLRCHHCGYQQRLINQCPACQTGELIPLGLGTERVEQNLGLLFPDKKIIRLDRDSTQRKGSLEKHLNLINDGQADIILGTQMLAKGHHFPNVTLVAILDVDSGLFSIDYRATEKLAQLIIQVGGRAGRAEKSGVVVLQTRQPDHSLLTTLLNRGYNAFAKEALQERQDAELPPFSFQVLIRAYATDPKLPILFLKAVVALISTIATDSLVLGPVSAPMAKRLANYHFQLLLQNSKRSHLQHLLKQLVPKIYQLKEAYKVRWSLDIDPIDLY